MLALALFVHFYMGYMTCIFVVIYALFYVIRSKEFTNIKVIFERMLKSSLRFDYRSRDGCGDSIANHHQFSFY